MRNVFAVVLLSLALAGSALAQDKIRVFIEPSKSIEITGNRGGEHDQTVELIKTFTQKCPAITINNDKTKADYVVTFDHEGGKGIGQHDNKIAVFNRDGDLVFTRSTVTLGGAVEGACTAITSGSRKQAVAITVTETERQQKYSKPNVTYAIVDDLTAYFTTKGVAGSAHIIVDRPLSKWVKVTVTFTPEQGAAWNITEDSGSWGMTGDIGLRSALSKLHAALDKKFETLVSRDAR